MSINVEAYLDDTGGQEGTLYDMLLGVIDEGLEAIKDGTLVVSAHRLRGALAQLYVEGSVVENLKGVTSENVGSRSKLVVLGLNGLKDALSTVV